MTDKQRFIQLLNDFNIKFDYTEEDYGSDIIIIDDRIYAFFEFDISGKFSKYGLEKS